MTSARFAAIAAALVMLPASAGAQDSAFDGPRVGAIVGIDETDAAPGLGARSGLLYGVQLGYDRDLGGFVLGAEADIAASDARTETPAFTSEADRYLSAAVRAGFKLADPLLVYARGGIANTRISTSLGRFDQTGFTVGGGAEYAVAGRFYVRGEYRYSDYGSTLRGQQYVVGLGFRF